MCLSSDTERTPRTQVGSMCAEIGVVQRLVSEIFWESNVQLQTKIKITSQHCPELMEIIADTRNNQGTIDLRKTK